MQVYGSERCGSEIIWCHTKSRTEITDHHRLFAVNCLSVVTRMYVFQVYAKVYLQNGKELKQLT